MAGVVEKRQEIYLPLEIWHRIFFQHTLPNDLWTVGRQVCSMWRSEIPKIFAKKYLENPNMVQISFDCGMERAEHNNYFMRVDMFSNRNEGKRNSCCVFTENPATKSKRDGFRTETWLRQYESAKFGAWRGKTACYLGADPEARADGGRFDLPPYQIRIKSKANDMELPNLEYDVEKREFSFEWEGIFQCFYREATVLEKRERGIMAKATQWVNGGDRFGVSRLSEKNKAARRRIAKEIRRDRIKEWYLETLTSKRQRRTEP